MIPLSAKTLAEMALVFGVVSSGINTTTLVRKLIEKRAERLARKVLHRPEPPQPMPRTITVADIVSITLRPDDPT